MPVNVCRVVLDRHFSPLFTRDRTPQGTSNKDMRVGTDGLFDVEFGCVQGINLYLQVICLRLGINLSMHAFVLSNS